MEECLPRYRNIGLCRVLLFGQQGRKRDGGVLPHWKSAEPSHTTLHNVGEVFALTTLVVVTRNVHQYFRTGMRRTPRTRDVTNR